MRCGRVTAMVITGVLLAVGLSSVASASAPVLFTKGIMSEVKRTDVPAPEQIVERIEFIACAGEFEPFSLALRGRAEGNWMVTISDLRAQKGSKVIPASAIEVSLLWWEETRGHLGKYTRVTDWVLDPGARGIALEKDSTGWLWLTVQVPPDAAPGLYEGRLSLKEERGEKVEVPVALEVLPVKLERVPGVQFCLLSTVAFGQYHDANSRAQRRPQALRFYRELKDHGMTGIAAKCSDWRYPVGYRRGHFEGLEACVEAAMEVGLDGPVIWYMSSLINGVKGGRKYANWDGRCDNWNQARDLANLREIVQTVQKLGKEKGWPEVIFRTVDEPGTQTEDRKLRGLRLGTILPGTLKLVHELGARGATTISEPVDNKHNRMWVKEPNELRKQWDLSRPYCHIRIYAYGYPQGRTNLEFEKADCGRRGHEMWFYHNPAIMGRDRYCARTYFGIWGWKVGARGLTAWTYPGGRSLQFELVREGIDDFKYLALLEKLIKEKRGSEEARAEAQKFLDGLSDSIKLDESGAVTDWKLVDFSTFKPRLASLIKKLVR